MLMPSQPLISIIIPTRDRADLLRETLDSVLAQTFETWEAVVIDDHSTDQTPQYLREMSAEDARIRFFSLNDKSGAPAARNLGIAEARGELVIFLDSDDLLAPHCLERRIEFIAARPELDFAVFPCQLFLNQPGDIELLWN